MKHLWLRLSASGQWEPAWVYPPCHRDNIGVGTSSDRPGIMDEIAQRGAVTLCLNARAYAEERDGKTPSGTSWADCARIATTFQEPNRVFTDLLVYKIDGIEIDRKDND